MQKLLTRLKQIGYNSLTGGIAIDALSKVIQQDETILKMIEGVYRNTVGVVIATDMRIFYVGVDKHKKAIVEQRKYDEISSVEAGSPVVVSVNLSIRTQDEKKLTFRGCDRKESQQFVELIKMLTPENGSPDKRKSA